MTQQRRPGRYLAEMMRQGLTEKAVSSRADLALH